MVKIKFRWSFIYEASIHNKEEDDFKKIEEEVKNFIEKVSLKWKPLEEKIFSYIENLTGLKWKSKEINCYVIHTSDYMPISDPLTIAIRFRSGNEIFELTPDRFLNMLIHEIIHNLFIENEKETDYYFKELLDSCKYSQNWNVSTHIPIHAIYEKIFLKFFDKKRLDKEIEIASFYPEYKESWEIVKKEGSLNIIAELKSFEEK